MIKAYVIYAKDHKVFAILSVKGGVSTDDVTIAVLIALLGETGIVGLVFWFFKRKIEERLKSSEEDLKRRKDIKIRRMQIEDELQHAYGRVFFWVYRAITTGQHNGELTAAFKSLEEIEQRKKNLDRDIISDKELD